MSKKSLIIIIVAVVIIVGGIYLVKSSRSLNREPASDQKQVATNQEQKADILDWKTYQNQKYGFSLRYPKDWNLFEPPKAPSVFYAMSPERLFRVMSVSIHKNSTKDKVLSNLYGDIYPNMLVLKRNVGISGIDGTELTFKIYDRCTRYVFIPLGSNVFEAHYQSSLEAFEKGCDKLSSPEFDTFVSNISIEK